MAALRERCWASRVASSAKLRVSEPGGTRMSAYRPDVPGNSLTLVEVLRGRAQAQPHQRACTFLPHSDTEELHLTYAELDTRARAIASVLQQKVAPAERAL